MANRLVTASSTYGKGTDYQGGDDGGLMRRIAHGGNLVTPGRHPATT